MATAVKQPKINRIGAERARYEGSKSTLCIGCGHDQITRNVIDALWHNGIEPHKVAKLSGIGCSSKTPAYFLGESWGFNAVHGRMPSIATGVNATNRSLLCVGVSGDGDTASIGMGQFVHMVRRNPQCLYIIEDNGVYGLTKGQFSATAEQGAKLKTGASNPFGSIDMCSLSIELGCGFVARSFSGNIKQMQAILRAAAAYPGLAVIDVISPCVTFNNFDFSTRGFNYMKEHEVVVNDFGFVPSFEDIEAEMGPDTVKDVEFPDGGVIRFRTLREDHDPTDRESALRLLHQTYEKGEMLTGIFYVDPNKQTFAQTAGAVDTPLGALPDSMLRPGAEALTTVMERFE